MMSDGRVGPGSGIRALGRAATACIALALAIMLVMSFNGPSVTVSSAIGHDGVFPPWWHALHLRPSAVLLSLWAAAGLGTAGLIGGLVAIARGARPSVRAMVIAALVVTAAFTVLPAAGSTDAVSYAIDGTIAAAGHSPYAMTPGGFIAAGGTIAKYGSPTWYSSLSDYGPLATWTEWLAVKLGAGGIAPLHIGQASIAPITAWLKLWTGISFAAVILLLDWLLRGDPAMRRRAHLLWSLNPLILWEIVASGHIDGLSIAFGLAGIGLLWTRRPGTSGEQAMTAGRAVLAGLLIGAAIAVKIPYAVYGLAGIWVLRRDLKNLAFAALGGLAVLVPSYALAGKDAITVLFNRGGQVTWDNLYQFAWRRPFNIDPMNAPRDLTDIAWLLVLGLAALLLWRLPRVTPQWPAVPVALSLSMAWILLFPFQRPWYDVMVIGLLALYPASRLDWIFLVRLGFGAVTYFAAVTLSVHDELGRFQYFEGDWLTSAVRLLAVIAVAWLCVTGRWGWRSGATASSESALELQPLS
jgi:hypothetical protein